VVHQAAGRRERLAARLADMRLLPRVCPHVRGQVVGPRERLAARLTLEAAIRAIATSSSDRRCAAASRSLGRRRAAASTRFLCICGTYCAALEPNTLLAASGAALCARCRRHLLRLPG
jgi:hypothetical protein